MQTSFDIVFPIGAAGNFIKYWIGVGLGYFEEKDPIPLEYWNKYYPPPHDDSDLNLVPSSNWCEEINEYCVQDKRLPGRHPSHIMFSDPNYQIHNGCKRVLVDSYDCKDYVFNLFKIKKTLSSKETNWESLTKGPIDEDEGPTLRTAQMKFEDKVKLDSKICRAVYKRLQQQNIPSVILDYKKFFIEQSIMHIDEVANFVGFDSSDATLNLIKYYTERNNQLYESNSLY
jgi:hypothetical protein